MTPPNADMTTDTPTDGQQSPGNDANSQPIHNTLSYHAAGQSGSVSASSGDANSGAPSPPGHRLPLGRLPDAERAVERACYAFRRGLERAVVEAHGRVSLPQAAAISTATRWERVARVAARRLAERGTDMSDECYLAYVRETAKASGERDKAIDRLALPKDKATTIFDVLYGPRSGDATRGTPGGLPLTPLEYPAT